MAAGFLQAKAGDLIKVFSAGTMPASEINPVAIEVMLEKGIDISKSIPQKLSEEAVKSSDYVITMGCGDSCPVFPGKTYLDWNLDDPAGKSIEAVREICDDIEKLVENLVRDIKK